MEKDGRVEVGVISWVVEELSLVVAWWMEGAESDRGCLVARVAEGRGEGGMDGRVERREEGMEEEREEEVDEGVEERVEKREEGRVEG